MHIAEKCQVVFHHLPVDREWIRQQWLVLRAVGEDYGPVLAEPRGRDVDGGLDGHVAILSCVLYVNGFTLTI